MLLQGICNEEKKFIDCYAGEVGSVHDATVLKRSPIYRDITTGVHGLSEELHLLGDSAYPLSNFILTPYKNYGRLTRRQKEYNKCLSSARVRIENTFGIMKSRFRRLKLVENRRPDFIVIIIMSCCILHNICMDHGDVMDLDPDVLDDQIANLIPNEQQRIVGRNKRNAICNSL